MAVAVAAEHVLEDGTECAFAPEEFSDSDDDRPAPTITTQQPRTLEELRKAYESDLHCLKEVKIHNHHDRAIYTLPVSQLDSMRGMAKDLPRVDGKMPSLATAEAFAESEYVRDGRPVLLSGLTSHWRAAARWSSQAALVESYGHVPLRITEIPPPLKGFGNPRVIRLPLALYAEYACSNDADDPFYGFDHDFTGPRKELLEDFEVPPQFTEDVYDSNSTTRSFYPQFRHMIIGGRRTGTNMHIDPKFTCAWNTLLCGRKRWICFPPSTDPNKIGAGVEYQKQTPVSYWWLDVYPTLDLEALGAVEGIQEAGDTIFVPSGWHHAVLNLDFTVAITQNLVMPSMLDAVLPKLSEEYPEFGAYLKAGCCEDDATPSLEAAQPKLDEVDKQHAPKDKELDSIQETKGCGGGGGYASSKPPEA